MARSTKRMRKERAIRQRRLKNLWARLKELQAQKITRDTLLLCSKWRRPKKNAGRFTPGRHLLAQPHRQPVQPGRPSPSAPQR